MRFVCLVSIHLLAMTAAADPLPVPPTDKGVFDDLTPKASLAIPPWIPKTSPRLVRAPEAPVATLVMADLPVKSYPLVDGDLRPGDVAELRAHLGQLPPLEVAPRRRLWRDADGDGIPDSVDAMIGARKVALNGAAYIEGYQRIAYPGGDVDRERGVCTDVIVRALRNAGHDLQRLVISDMKRRPQSYGLPAGKRPNKNVDHRRVRRQIVYFRRHHRALSNTFDAAARGRDAWLPGDIVFLDTFPHKSGPDHVGLVSDRVDAQGRPLIINNWTTGWNTKDMALLGDIPVTHRFRVSVRK